MRSLAEKETLLREVHHRVKNNLQVIASLLRIRSENLKDESASSALRESHQRVLFMALIHEQLYGNQKMDRIDFGAYAQKLVTELIKSYGERTDRLEYRFNLGPVFLQVDEAIPCGLILNELVTNVIKYAYPGSQFGDVCIHLSEDNENLVTLSVADHGVGLPAGFRWDDSKSMGLPIVNLLTKQLGGVLHADSNGGTTFSIHFPKHKLKASATAA